MQPWAAEYYKKIRNGPLRNPYDKALDEFDPALSCFPRGPTRLYMTPGLEIVQTPNVVYFLFEDDHWVRRIFMDGRERKPSDDKTRSQECWTTSCARSGWSWERSVSPER